MSAIGSSLLIASNRGTPYTPANDENALGDWKLGAVKGGICRASGEYSEVGEFAVRAFDHNPKTKWLEPSGANALFPAWLEYRLIPDATAPVVVASYTVTSANDHPERDPSCWVLEGLAGLDEGDSTAEDMWQILDAQTNVTFSKRFQKLQFLVSLAVPCYRWRLRISATKVAGTKLQLSCWSLFKAQMGSGNRPVVSTTKTTSLLASLPSLPNLVVQIASMAGLLAVPLSSLHLAVHSVGAAGLLAVPLSSLHLAACSMGAAGLLAGLPCPWNTCVGLVNVAGLHARLPLPWHRVTNVANSASLEQLQMPLHAVVCVISMASLEELPTPSHTVVDATNLAGIAQLPTSLCSGCDGVRHGDSLGQQSCCTGVNTTLLPLTFHTICASSRALRWVHQHCRRPQHAQQLVAPWYSQHAQQQQTTMHGQHTQQQQTTMHGQHTQQQQTTVHSQHIQRQQTTVHSQQAQQQQTTPYSQHAQQQQTTLHSQHAQQLLAPSCIRHAHQQQTTLHSQHTQQRLGTMFCQGCPSLMGSASTLCILNDTTPPERLSLNPPCHSGPSTSTVAATNTRMYGAEMPCRAAGCSIALSHRALQKPPTIFTHPHNVCGSDPAVPCDGTADDDGVNQQQADVGARRHQRSCTVGTCPLSWRMLTVSHFGALYGCRGMPGFHTHVRAGKEQQAMQQRQGSLAAAIQPIPDITHRAPVKPVEPQSCFTHVSAARSCAYAGQHSCDNGMLSLPGGLPQAVVFASPSETPTSSPLSESTCSSKSEMSGSDVCSHQAPSTPVVADGQELCALSASSGEPTASSSIPGRSLTQEPIPPGTDGQGSSPPLIPPAADGTGSSPKAHSVDRGKPTAWWHPLVCGPVAGVVSRVATYPFDTLKARMQVSGTLTTTDTSAPAPGSSIKAGTAQMPTIANTPALGRGISPGSAPHLASTGGTNMNVFDSFRRIIKAEGPAALYRGLGPTLVGVLPANMAYFGGYEFGRWIMPASCGNMGADIGAGVAAQLLAGLVYTPVDILKERLQVQSVMGGGYRYNSSWHAMRALLSGGASGVFKGYWVTNSVWLPWNVVYIAGYEQAKRAAAVGMGVRDAGDLPSGVVAGCAALAAGVAAVLTHPADVVKTRLQVLSGVPGRESLTAAMVLRETMQQEGWKALTKGATARVLHIAPGCAISWAMYEACKSWLQGPDRSTQ